MPALYIKIASDLREMIKNGTLPPHAPLPERQLAEVFNTGRSTIAAAFKVLKMEGYVESYAKQYTRVSQLHPEHSECWDKFVRTGMSAPTIEQIMNTFKYLAGSGKQRLTYGYHEEFKLDEPLRRTFESLAKKPDMLDSLNHFHIQGLPVLRETLAGHMKRYGMDVDPEHIVVFNGFSEAVFTVSAALLNHGTNFYAADNDMMQTISTIRSTGANIHAIPVDAQGPVATAFEQMIRRNHLNMLYINSINSFPSGLTYSERRQDELLMICEKHNVPILENDFLRDIWINPPPPPLKSKNSDRVIYIGSLANSFNMGVRFGWGVFPPAVLRRITSVKSHTSSGNNSGVELIMNEMLSKGYYYDFLDNFRTELADRNAKVNETLAKYLTGYAKWNPEATLYSICLEFDDDTGTAYAAESLCPRLRLYTEDLSA